MAKTPALHMLNTYNRITLDKDTIGMGIGDIPMCTSGDTYKGVGIFITDKLNSTAHSRANHLQKIKNEKFNQFLFGSSSRTAQDVEKTLQKTAFIPCYFQHYSCGPELLLSACIR